MRKFWITAFVVLFPMAVLGQSAAEISAEADSACNRVRSVWLTMPTKRPFSTVSRWRSEGSACRAR